MSVHYFEVSKTARFDAAHHLAAAGEGRYARLHGHSFEVEATLRGPAVGPVGWVEDLGALGAALNEAAEALDHTMLNEHPGLENPTLEALCVHFATRLGARFPQLARVAVSRPTIGERCEMVLDPR